MPRATGSIAFRRLFGLMILLLLFAACRPVTAQRPSLLRQVAVGTAPTPPAEPRVPRPMPAVAVVATQPPTPVPTPALPKPTPIPEPIDGPVTVGLDGRLPESVAAPVLATLNRTVEIQTASGPQLLIVLDEADNAGAQVKLLPITEAAFPLATRVLAVVAPFETVRDDIAFSEVVARWRDPNGAGPIFVTPYAAEWLDGMLGVRAAANETVGRKDLLARLENTPGSLGIVSFEQLDPRFKTLTVDNVNVLSNQFVASRYPLAATLSVDGVGASLLRPLLASVVTPATNRDATRLTQLIMTGVTAMSRVTALRMDQKGYDYPALVISDVLSIADITHISNEVPFLDDCVANPTENNLILCSDTEYWAALEAVGTDIVGLSGNHVNDFGREGARRSITWYRENGIPIYGSGLNVDEACAPLFWEDHGNLIAFIAVLAFGPSGAWASADQPGACYYYDNEEQIVQLVRQLAPQVDILAVELQHQETYEPYPIPVQVQEFRELREAGADIVTGVMSHVPQAQEPYGQSDPGEAGMITYGLGNLFFDQMWSWETRTELAARHTIYDGRLLNTELLTMVLEDFAQPRWATPEERADILTRIFNAGPPRP